MRVTTLLIVLVSARTVPTVLLSNVCPTLLIDSLPGLPTVIRPRGEYGS